MKADDDTAYLMDFRSPMDVYSRRPPRGKGTYVCRFAAGRLLPLLDAALREAEGVRKGEDIEYLHRMRVASRRMRACLQTFRPYLGERRFKRVYRRTREITRALSQARDADVQIAYLRKLRKREMKRLGTLPEGESAGEVRPLLEAVRFLLQKFRKERARYQDDVVAALDRFEKEVPPVIRSAFQGLSPLPAHPKRRGHVPSTVHVLAADQAGSGLRELFVYAPWVHTPDAVADHHAMRIAAKKLRYTLEIFAPLYRLGLQKYISRIAHLQGLLGDLHDTDVWIDTITLLLLHERSRPLSPDDPSRPAPTVIAGLKQFQRDREKDRKRIYRSMVRYWDHLERTGFWEGLRREIFSNYRAALAPGGPLPEEEKRDAVALLARLSAGGETHPRHVMHLSLSLFDQLRELHGLGEEERVLLEYGCLLHDIGLARGRKGHARAGAFLIHATENLPFTVRERAVTSLLARVHRGTGREEESGYLSLLPPEEQKKILVLGGILRVADGLDCTHRGKVQAARCSISAGTVTIHISSPIDCPRERETAQKKADLLGKALGVTIGVEQETGLSHAGTPGRDEAQTGDTG